MDYEIAAKNKGELIMVNDKRSLGMYILLSFVTCGIYSWVFIYHLANDMNVVCAGDGDETPDLLMFIVLSFVTCGIYGIYWYYKLGNRQAANARRYNVNITENGTSILVWMLIGSLIAGIGYFVAMHIVIKNMNLLAYAYNNSYMSSSANRYAGTDYNRPGAYNQNMNTPNNYNNYSSTFTSQNTVPMNSAINLRCTSGEFAGSVFTIEPNDTILIGRDFSCNVKLDANTPNVSRRHCTVLNENGVLYVIDNNSSFGTFLNNGTRLQPNMKTEVKPGSGFWLGNKNICFSVS